MQMKCLHGPRKCYPNLKRVHQQQTWNYSRNHFDRILQATMYSLLSIPSDLFKERILSLLCIEDVARLDLAVLNHESREYFLEGLKGASIPPSEHALVSRCTLKWLHARDTLCKVLHFAHDVTDTDIGLYKKALAKIVEVKFVCCQEISGSAVAQIVVMSNAFRKLVFYNCCRLEYNTFYDLRSYSNAITHVGFINCTVLEDEAFAQFIKCCTSLEVVDITGSISLTNYALYALERKCPHLRELYITDGLFESLDGEGLLSIAQGCPKFETLVLGEFAADLELGELAKKCPNLTRLDIGMNQDLSHAGLLTLAENTSKLRSFELDNCYMRGIEDEALIRLLQRNPYLQNLKVESWLNITPAALLQIPTCCVHLQSLQLGNFETISADVFVSLLDGCRALTSLALLACDNINDAVVTQITQCCPKLRHLELAECGEGFSTEALTALFTACTQLEYLNFEENICTTLSDTTLSALGKNCPRLHTLLLNKCTFTESSLVAFSSYCTTLTRFEANFTDISEAGLVAVVAANMYLERLCVDYCAKLTDTAMNAITTHCKKLTALRLSHCTGVTTAGFLPIVLQCRRLQEVCLTKNAFVNNKCITLLAQHCPRLEVLRANECKRVTDAITRVLFKHCRYLRLVELKYNVKVLKKALVHLEILYDGQVTTDEFPKFD